MKTLPIFIILAALVLGIRQEQVSTRLAERERQLLSRQAALQVEEEKEARKPASGEAAALPTKTERTEKPKFNAARYIGKIYKVVLLFGVTGKQPSMEDTRFLERDLLNATPEDLVDLPKNMRRAMMPDFIASGIYEFASPRLLDKDPVLASEFAIKGGMIDNFIFVMHSWMARDPAAANAWLAAKAQADPPLNEKTFPPIFCRQEPLDVASLQLAASIATAPGNADLSALMDLKGSKLKATLNDVVAVLPPDGLPALLKRMSESGHPDLIAQTLKQHPEPALAREYLHSAALPPAEFMEAATTIVAGLDPASLPRGMDWYLRNTEAEARAEGLREIVTRWTTENPRSASRWLQKLPPGKDREIAEAAHAAGLDQVKDKLLSGP